MKLHLDYMYNHQNIFDTKILLNKNIIIRTSYPLANPI